LQKKNEPLRGSSPVFFEPPSVPDHLPRFGSLLSLRSRTHHGKLGPAEKTENEGKWSEAWNPSEPIEELFDRLEECYVLALVNKP
jgi:hypothetical protein